MSFFVSSDMAEGDGTTALLKRGSKRIIVLFLITICFAVLGHSVLGMPPVLGMMTGLGLLQVFSFYLVETHASFVVKVEGEVENAQTVKEMDELRGLAAGSPFNIFGKVAQAEWDTLLFFYGVVLCVGGLGFIGYLALISNAIYADPVMVTWANVAVGVLSAIVDNIPVMFAVLTMQPAMSEGQWLLVTLTAGVGGSLLSIGSAAGVALMGQAQGMYTFGSHIKWMPIIALGYAASIVTHLWLSGML
jgi:Na+/H+ antiporter NhaD/arsenite permease-like protein